MTDQAILMRYDAARRIADEAGALALEYFRHWDTLTIDRKGHQDFVSEADRNVEVFVRAALSDAFPDDGIVGEEAAPTPGISGYTWVIDPIDGTTNFINGIPQWCVIIACVHGQDTVVGVVHDPLHGECHHAMRGGGAFCNDRPIRATAATSLHEGSLGIGFSGRVHSDGIKTLVALCSDAGTIFWRNGSGGLSLAYVASGRVLGYVEEHMNAWDFLAGQLIVAEAGGTIEPTDAGRALTEGARVVVGGPGVFSAIKAIADGAFPAA